MASQPSPTAWQWLLLLGGLAGITGAALSLTRHYRIGTRLESLGAGIIAAEVLIYLSTVAATDTLATRPWATLVWIGLAIPPGMIWRAWEAQRDREWREAVEAFIGEPR